MLNKDEIVNLQYEIAMAIGSSLVLNRMLRECLSTIQRRLNCPIGGVFYASQSCDDKPTLKHILSIPLNGHTFPVINEGINSIQKKNLDAEFRQQLEVGPFLLKLESNHSLLVYNLPDFGILYLYKTDQFFIEDITRTLSPMLMKKLAVSCKACMQNQELEQTYVELKNTQSQLVQSEKMASLGILTAGVAHEINNPLNYLKGTLYGLENYFQENFPKESDTVVLLLESLKCGINRITDIVRGLNQFGRDNSRYDETCNIHHIIDNCLIMLKYQFKNKIFIEKNYAPKDLIINGNVGKLHQAFLNLLINSIQAIYQKGKIIIATDFDQRNALIKISDNGCGIHKDHLHKIIDPFFTTKPPGKGVGLGLSITYNIIKKHNGTLEFNSIENKGTTVIIKIKL
jgi:signal transduction histidine kinase